MCNCCIISGFGVFSGPSLAKNCTFLVVPLCEHHTPLCSLYTHIFRREKCIEFNPKTLLLYLLFTKQAMNRQTHTVIYVCAHICCWERERKSERFSTYIWSWLCMPNRGGGCTNTQQPFSHLCIVAFLFECALCTHYFSVSLVSRIAKSIGGDAKCGKTENLLPTVLVRLVNHGNECKLSICMHV
jgi:hypothetical protein